MNWLLYRQHRGGAIAVAAILTTFAVMIVVTGVHMAGMLHAARTTCAANGGDCSRFLGGLFDGYSAIIGVVHLTIVVPVVLGSLLGATLIARETEHATNVLVWTQGVSRRRWVLTKVAFGLVATLVVAGTTSALVTWWSGPTNSMNGDRFQGAQFDTQNIVPVAEALFAVALGIAAGAVLRRSLPAIATTVGVYIAVRIVVGVFLRPRYAAAHVLSLPLDGPAEAADIPPGSWRLSVGIVDAAGHGVSGPIEVPASCASLPRDKPGACLDQLHYRQIVRFHPASSYWHFQWIESGIYLGLAALLVAAAVTVTFRRDA